MTTQIDVIYTKKNGKHEKILQNQETSSMLFLQKLNDIRSKAEEISFSENLLEGEKVKIAEIKIDKDNIKIEETPENLVNLKEQRQHYNEVKTL